MYSSLWSSRRGRRVTSCLYLLELRFYFFPWLESVVSRRQPARPGRQFRHFSHLAVPDWHCMVESLAWAWAWGSVVSYSATYTVLTGCTLAEPEGFPPKSLIGRRSQLLPWVSFAMALQCISPGFRREERFPPV